MNTTYTTPAGNTWTVCDTLLKAPHVLIAGATGAGKSTFINSLMYSALIHSPAKVAFVLIDLKRVELWDYKTLPHTLAYADDLNGATRVLKAAVAVIEDRYQEMRQKGLKRYLGTQIYIIIDEYADLIIKSRTVEQFISDIAILGRGAGVHLIIATQRPTREIIGGAIAANLETRIALKTATAQDSRNIIAVKGAEELPPHGVGICRDGYKLDYIPIPLTPEAELSARIRYWTKQAN